MSFRHMIADRPLDFFHWLLWTTASTDEVQAAGPFASSERLNVDLVDLGVIVEGSLRKWYFTDTEGCIRQKHKSNLSLPSLSAHYQRLSSTAVPGNPALPVAVFICKSCDHVPLFPKDSSKSPSPSPANLSLTFPPISDTHILPFVSFAEKKRRHRVESQDAATGGRMYEESELNGITKTYLNAQALSDFAISCGRSVFPSGVLSYIPPPLSGHVSTVKVHLLRDRVFSIESLRNMNAFEDRLLSLKDRTSTESWQSVRLVHLSRTMDLQIRFIADRILRHIFSVIESKSEADNSPMYIRSCVLHFSISLQGQPVLSWTNPLQLELAAAGDECRGSQSPTRERMLCSPVEQAMSKTADTKTKFPAVIAGQRRRELIAQLAVEERNSRTLSTGAVYYPPDVPKQRKVSPLANHGSESVLRSRSRMDRAPSRASGTSPSGAARTSNASRNGSPAPQRRQRSGQTPDDSRDAPVRRSSSSYAGSNSAYHSPPQQICS